MMNDISLALIRDYKRVVLDLNALKLEEDVLADAEEQHKAARIEFEGSFYSFLGNIERDDIDTICDVDNLQDGEKTLIQLAEALGMPSLSEYEVEDLIAQLEAYEQQLLAEEMANN
jgi:hypothetical protein